MRYFYWYLYVLLWLFACIAPYISLKAQKRLLALYCAIWAFVFGFRRYDVGNDTIGYAAYFKNKGSGWGYGTVNRPFDTAEEGFVFVSRIINIFTENATVVFLIIGIAVWSMMYLLYKKSRNPLLSLFFLMTILNVMFYTMQIALRQSISVIVIGCGVLCIYHSCVKNIKDVLRNKWALAGILLCLSSITIHRTTGAFIGLLVLAYYLKLNKKSTFAIILSFTIIGLFAAQLLSNAFDYALVMIGGVTDENINLLADRYEGNMDTNRFSRGGAIAWIILVFSTCFLTKEKDINRFPFKLFVLTFCLHQLLQFSQMHVRVMALPIILSFTACVPNIFHRRSAWYNYYLLLGLMLLALNFNWLSNWDTIADRAVPYYFIWQK